MNIYEFAMQMEKDGQQFYRETAQKIDDKGLITIVNMLVDDEVKHYQIMKKMQASQKTEIGEEAILKNAKNVFAQLKEEGSTFEPMLSQVKFYKKAQELEQKSEDFYREKAKEVEDAQYQEIFLKIADEEKRHYFLLDNLVEFVSRPDTWLENAEFHNLDVY